MVGTGVTIFTPVVAGCVVVALAVGEVVTPVVVFCPVAGGMFVVVAGTLPVVCFVVTVVLVEVIVVCCLVDG